jgi:hypothetical protein
MAGVMNGRDDDTTKAQPHPCYKCETVGLFLFILFFILLATPHCRKQLLVGWFFFFSFSQPHPTSMSNAHGVNLLFI